ncbi:MAG: hypothetical protein IE927_04845 [Rhodobacterales bacterium]|nr:hypothetical protein [Rhodobacterales bacterium]
MGIFLRWFGAFALLTATFNPTPWNYVRWAGANYATELPLTVFLGLLLAVGYIIYLQATLNSIGGAGMVLIGAILAALIWVLIDWGILSLANTSLNVWLGILAMSVVLGIGLSWGLIRQRISGQATVDDIDE